MLQLCPHDAPPFGALCERYRQAAASIGVEMTTVYLGVPDTQPLPFCEYLNMSDLADTKALRSKLARFAHTGASAGEAGAGWDLVLCHRYRAYWAVVGTPLAARPCVVLAHEYGLLARWQRRLNRRLFARSFRFAGVAPEVAADLAHATGTALVLPNVMDVDAASGALLSREDACALLGLSTEAFNVGVVGRLHYKKRPGMAAQAFQAFADEHADAQLVFVGTGNSAELSGFVDAKNIRLTGTVPQAARAFAAFDVLLHTALDEPFGMVVLEAMCAGIPVVALPVGGPRYVLGELGYFAESDTPQSFAQALLRAAKVDRARYLEQAHQRVRQNFSISALASELDQLLTEGGAPGSSHSP